VIRYDALLKLWPLPVVALNSTAALAMVPGPSVAGPGSWNWSGTGGWRAITRHVAAFALAMVGPPRR
jgi:hypothetical protein